MSFKSVQQQFQFRMSEQNKLRSKSNQHHKKYQKFMNDVYSCIRERQHLLKRCSTPDIIDNFPCLLQQDRTSGLYSIQQTGSQPKTSKIANSQVKNIKFRSFLNAIDEHQRKISVDNMNLLGLAVKKINYCEKNKKNSQKQTIEYFDQNACSTVRPQSEIFTRSEMRKTINSQNNEQLFCKRIGMSFRQKSLKSKVARVSSRNTLTRTSQRSMKSRSEQKKKICPEFQNPIYDNRIFSYRQLIFKLNIAHGVYVQTQQDLKQEYSFRSQARYKAWVGSGNNGQLIKSLIKRRFWWVIVDQKSLNVNFIWTQLKINDFFNSQTPSPMWIKDTSKVWGHAPEIQQGFKTIKKLIRQKKPPKQLEDQDFLYKIFTQEQIKKYKQYNKRITNKGSYNEKKQFLQLPQINSHECKMHNHLINNFYLGNKKAMFYNLKQYYDLIGVNAFTKIPLTFHIKKGFKDLQYKRFLAYYKRRQSIIKKQQKQDAEKGEQRKMRNVWIVKPGQLTNRGNGITVIDEIYELNQIIKREGQHDNGAQKTFIVQLYLDRPLLYNKRKFDIRHYMLITHIHGLMRAYWFKEGYIRTSSYEFDIHNFEREIHLTNDAVQKYTSHYGRYQPANKISYAEFQRYLDSTYPKKNYNFQQQILPQMKKICLDAVKSSYLKLSPQRLKHNFQLFGLDFMIDENFKPWLIEINTNPCLQLSCPLLARIIPQAVDQALRLSLDIVFPPPCHYPNTSKHLAPDAGLQYLNYQLIFDQKRDGGELRALYKKSTNDLLQEIGNISQDQTYQDDGKDVAFDQFL